MSETRRKLRTILAAVVAAGLVATTMSPTSARKSLEAESFASPQQAASALFEAAKAKDLKAIMAVLGPANGDWILSGDSAQDAQRIERFASAYAQKVTITNAGDAKALLSIGNDDFPFAFPIVKRGGTWSFDAQAGREELLNRTIGRNELDTIQTLLAIVDAQHEYASLQRSSQDVSAYATRFRSRPGKTDGLYWPTRANEPPSPLGLLVAAAEREGYRADVDGPSPFHGYYYRILTGQGPHAAGGEYSYIVRGRMIGGFAVLAYPARYGVSGIKTFAVDNSGAVIETDLGPKTNSLAPRVRHYDPGPAWKAVEHARY
jgi:hypothetical protein